MTPETIKRLAEEINDRYYDTDCDSFRQAVIEVLTKHFPPPPPGSVEVEIAVSVLNFSCDNKSVLACAIDSRISREAAQRDVQCRDDTHRSIVRAVIHPVASVPVVDGDVVG